MNQADNKPRIQIREKLALAVGASADLTFQLEFGGYLVGVTGTAYAESAAGFPADMRQCVRLNLRRENDTVLSTLPGTLAGITGTGEHPAGLALIFPIYLPPGTALTATVTNDNTLVAIARIQIGLWLAKEQPDTRFLPPAG